MSEVKIITVDGTRYFGTHGTKRVVKGILWCGTFEEIAARYVEAELMGELTQVTYSTNSSVTETELTVQDRERFLHVVNVMNRAKELATVFATREAFRYLRGK